MTTTELPAIHHPRNGEITRADNGPGPSINDVLMHAMERGIDPASMEKLLALKERMAATEAEAAFNLAMSEFRAVCPALKKNKIARNEKQGGREMYRYADLAYICSQIDPLLPRFGLSYKFDMTVEASQYTTTCTVKHVGGHRESSSFSCPAAGSSMMNAAQMVGSATSYGRRYALLFALGLAIDIDDDGKGIPGVKPEADSSSPKVAPRGERKTAVSPGTLNDFYKRFYAGIAEDDMPSDRKGHFAEWCSQILGATVDLTNPANWTPEMVAAIEEKLS